MNPKLFELHEHLDCHHLNCNLGVFNADCKLNYESYVIFMCDCGVFYVATGDTHYVALACEWFSNRDFRTEVDKRLIELNLLEEGIAYRALNYASTGAIDSGSTLIT
jgi:hypothetical protein